MTLCLEKEEILSIEGKTRRLIASCLFGELWITQARDKVDYKIIEGESFKIEDRKWVQIKALDSSSVSLSAAKRLRISVTTKKNSGQNHRQVQTAQVTADVR